MEAIENHLLTWVLKDIHLSELKFLKQNKRPLYTYHQNNFLKVLNQSSVINKTFITNYAKSYGRKIFLYPEDYNQIQKNIKQSITTLSRSISLGDTLENSKSLSNLLTKNLNLLYQDPYNDELLQFQHRHTQNFGNFLLEHPKLHKQLYRLGQSSSNHFLYKHPMQTSIFLLSYLQDNNLFSKEEIISLFLVNYFKDIGMGLVDESSHNKNELNKEEKIALSKHAKFSVEILKNRIPLSTEHLNIIENHHFLNAKIQEFIDQKSKEKKSKYFVGLESSIISAIDTFVALNSDRPYRKALSVFETLNILKNILSEDYSQEYKDFVIFVSKFISK